MNNSWYICISGEYDLNFLMFVASVHGLLTEEFEEAPGPLVNFQVLGEVIKNIKSNGKSCGIKAFIIRGF